MTARCKDCGRFIPKNQEEPVRLCNDCIDKKLEAFKGEMLPIAERV